jgi:hypothetical protein
MVTGKTGATPTASARRMIEFRVHQPHHHDFMMISGKVRFQLRVAAL